MVVVPAGSFMMGTENPDTDGEIDEDVPRLVTIERPFAVGRREVTFAEWDACVAAGGCSHRPEDMGWGRGDRPVINISWDDAIVYLDWLRRETGQAYRLPTRPEWEYAARAGTNTRYWWGDAIGHGNANCNGCGSRWDGNQTAPAGNFAANPFGLHDVHGNVWERVGACWEDSYSAIPSEASQSAGSLECFASVCGGSLFDEPSVLRVTACLWDDGENRYTGVGFRVARNLD